MIVAETTNTEDILTVLKHPDIWECIADKNQSPDDFVLPEGEEYKYIVGHIEDELVGVMIYQNINKEWWCHVQVLPHMRNEYGLQFGQNVLKWFWDNMEESKIKAKIPEEYPNVVQFAIKNGFSLNSVENGVNYLSIGRG